MEGRNSNDASSSKRIKKNLLDLPDEVIAKILAENASGNMKHYFRAKAVCKTLRTFSVHDDTLHGIDLIKVHIPRLENGWGNMIPGGAANLKQACLDCNNPTAVFLKGISDFMYTEDRDEGFRQIKQASINGLKVAKYAYEVIRQSIAPEADVGSRIPLSSRATIRVLRRQVVECMREEWPHGITVHLALIRESVDLGRLSTCLCAVHNDWLDWWHEDVKGRGMCDACFWAIEISVFFRIVPRAFAEWPN